MGEQLHTQSGVYKWEELKLDSMLLSGGRKAVEDGAEQVQRADDVCCHGRRQATVIVILFVFRRRRFYNLYSNHNSPLTNIRPHSSTALYGIFRTGQLSGYRVPLFPTLCAEFKMKSVLLYVIQGPLLTILLY